MLLAAAGACCHRAANAAPVFLKMSVVRRRGSREVKQRKSCVVSAAIDAPEAQNEAELAEQDSMDEYLALKQFLLKRTQRSAGFLTIYILLAIGDRVRVHTLLPIRYSPY